MSLQPLHDRVIIKVIEAETKTPSGIVLSPGAEEKPTQGEVLAAGPGRTNERGEVIPMSVKAGDRVLFGKYSGQTVTVGGEEVVVMREEELIAKVV
jgi:chaperonin GroES